MPEWQTHVGNNTVLEDDVVFLHKQEELAVARGLGRKPFAQVRLPPCYCYVSCIITQIAASTNVALANQGSQQRWCKFFQVAVRLRRLSLSLNQQILCHLIVVRWLCS